MKSPPVINVFKKTDDFIASTDKDKSKLFNDLFTSVFTHEDISSMPFFSVDSEVPIFNSITVTLFIIYSKLKNIKPGKSPGPEVSLS